MVFTQTNLTSISIPATVATTILSRTITTTSGQILKLDSMADISMTTNATDSNYTILYNLLDGVTIIASLTLQNAFHFDAGTGRVYIEIPNMTWIDTPSAGPHTYSIQVTITTTGFASPSSATTRALNIISLG